MKAKNQFRRVGVSKGLPWTETTRRAYDHKWQTPALCAFFSPRLDPTFAHSKMKRAPAYIWWKESPFFLLSDAFVSLKPVLVKGPRKLIYGRVISLGFNGFTKECVCMGPASTLLGISCIINLQAILYGWIKAPLVRFVGNNFAFRVRPLYVLLGEKQVTHNVSSRHCELR